MASLDGTNAQPFALPTALRAIVDTVWPEGGQRRARNNAWRAVCNDRIRASERDEARRGVERARPRLTSPAARTD